MKKRARFIVSGRVQGVCYRMCAQREARYLGLVGFVRNLRNGDVELVSEGEEDLLRQFADWCGRGPPYADVAGMETDYSETTGEFRDFTIAY